jgi:hypothetical protein
MINQLVPIIGKPAFALMIFGSTVAQMRTNWIQIKGTT